MKNQVGKKFKVLCLHGYGYNDAYIKMRLQGMALTKVEAIKFVLVISGGKLGGSKVPAPTLAKNAFSFLIEIPLLHYFGENDTFAKLPAIELLGSFVDPFVIFHSGWGSCIR
ncbi:hypothetical protein POM88_011052 [Heracleum sosnowskyi]|uniref:Serine hydrolase domain-containing protein n=1 Tax=Heracleum sosnowskyi TaxID=360622 RepID=A0AAD8N0X0_9APIA|nr:hypothetical protein POM88_011052 [Heracleum sosnowskyi]